MLIIDGNMSFNKKKSITSNLILYNSTGCTLYFKKFICDRFSGYFRFFSGFFF